MDEKYRYSDDIIGKIYRARCDIKKAKRGIGNAEFRITNDGSNIDKMWIKIKEEEQKKFNDAQTQFANLYSQLISSKSQYSKDQYENILREFGVVMGMTEDINHVETSLYDEYDLQKALDETGNMIKQKKEEIESAVQNGDEDLVTILTAELSYYERDMRKHHWGESRLEKLNSDSIKTR